MKLYQNIISNLTVEALVDMNVRLVHINNEQLCWLTSNGVLFPYNKHSEALNYEFNYLNQDLPEESNEESTTNLEIKENEGE